MGQKGEKYGVYIRYSAKGRNKKGGGGAGFPGHGDHFDDFGRFQGEGPGNSESGLHRLCRAKGIDKGH